MEKIGCDLPSNVARPGVDRIRKSGRSRHIISKPERFWNTLSFVFLDQDHGISYFWCSLCSDSPEATDSKKFSSHTLCAAFGLGDLKQSAAHLRLL